jgi:hypothetical protein
MAVKILINRTIDPGYRKVEKLKNEIRKFLNKGEE